MRQANKRIPESAEKTVRDIRRATRRHHSAEEKIRIVLEGLRGEDSIAELCRKEGINQNLYYRWSKVKRNSDRTYVICARCGEDIDAQRLQAPHSLRRGMIVWWSTGAGVHVEPTVTQMNRSCGCSRARWSSASAANSGSAAKATSWSFREVRSTRRGSAKTPR